MSQPRKGPKSNNGEVITSDPNTGGKKGVKLARYDLIPAGPLWLLAEHYGKGSLKYEERNWEKGYAWSKSFGAAKRHLDQFWLGEDIDPETGSPHTIAAAWHCFALTEWPYTYPEGDDRPHKGLWLPWEVEDGVGT